MKRNMKLGSLFDGSGGFPLGAKLAGIEPKWASEIEPFPIMVPPLVTFIGFVSVLSPLNSKQLSFVIVVIIRPFSFIFLDK